MGKKLYFPTEEGGIQFKTERRIGDVRIPNYIYDLWMPLIGSDAIGVYAVFCRLERSGGIKGITMQDIANACRIGKAKLTRLMKILEGCEFIETKKPTGQARLWHYTTEITVKDPAQEISKEVIEAHQPTRGYEPLTPWLIDEESPEIPNGTSGSTKQSFDEVPNGTSTVESSILNPLLVEGSAASATPPQDAQGTLDAQAILAMPTEQAAQALSTMKVSPAKAIIGELCATEHRDLLERAKELTTKKGTVAAIERKLNANYNELKYLVFFFKTDYAPEDWMKASGKARGFAMALAEKLDANGVEPELLREWWAWWRKVPSQWNWDGKKKRPETEAHILDSWPDFIDYHERWQAARKAEQESAAPVLPPAPDGFEVPDDPQQAMREILGMVSNV
jgi:hypothetical protein